MGSSFMRFFALSDLTLSGRAALKEPYALLVSKYAIQENCFETISGMVAES